MTKKALRLSLLLFAALLLLTPTLALAQDEPPVKGEAADCPSISQVSPQPEGGPDTYGYTWDVTALGYTSIVLSGTDITSNVAEGLCYQVPIGFTFPYYGSPKTQVYVCADGYLRFGPGVISDWIVDCGVVNANTPNDAIYGFWWDHDASAASGGGEILYRTMGTAPNRMFKVEFIDVENYWDDNNAQGTIQFSMTLYEGSGDILMQYLDVPGPPYYQHGAGGPAVGIEPSAGTAGLTYACDVDDVATVGEDVLFRYNFDLGDRVWYDADQDGIQGAGELGVEGIVVDLYYTADCSGQFLEGTTTDAAGAYLFNYVPPLDGSYCLEFSNIPSDWEITLQNQGGDDTIDSDVDPATGQIRDITPAYEDDMDLDMGLYEVKEEFVPEWGSIALLGSGLAGLAGYARLRWRKR